MKLVIILLSAIFVNNFVLSGFGDMPVFRCFEKS